ncbi:MAG TPA: hypothetical protein VFV66_10275 [Nonomuraea sp.]|nr:hypothetical protein [Nonomuraea sp.]
MLVWRRKVTVVVEAGPRGARGLTVRVPGEPVGRGPAYRRVEDPVVEYDEDERADPGGLEF